MTCAIRQWRDMERWIPGDAALPSLLHATVPLDDVLLPRLEHVRVQGALGEWAPITIHFDGSVEARQRTGAFKGSMFAAYPGDLVFSKIDVRNGALTIIPDCFTKVVVTGEYPVHTPDSAQVDAHYLSLILRAPEFQHQMHRAASGHSGRKRITAEIFRALEIPLPDLILQRQLVAAHVAAQAKARSLEQRAEALEQTARRDFEIALGLTPPPDLPRRFAQIARFRDIERWSHEGIYDGTILRDDRANFSLARLGDVIADLENGWSPQCEPRPAREGEWAVLKLGAVSFGTFDAQQSKALPLRFKPRAHLEVREGDVLISRANITHLVGACALVEETPPHLMLCDKIFRAVFFDDSPIRGDFLAEVMKTPGVRKQIESRVTGSSPTMKNISKPALLDLEFPLPPPNEQRRLVSRFQAARTKAGALRTQATSARQTAWREFVTAVFG